MIAPAVDAQQDSELVEIQAEAETTPAKVIRSPETPSAKQVEEHRSAGHIPYRDWCKWCLLGRGLDDQHRASAEKSGIAIVGLDYFYMTAGGIKFRKDLEQEENPTGEAALEEERRKGGVVKCLLMRCFETKIMFAHCIPYKGVGEDQYVTSLVVKNVEWLGHTKLIIKVDNEPALVALIKRSLEDIRLTVSNVAQVTLEHPPTYDSQSNGGIETGVRIIRGQFRTLKLCLESRIGKRIPINHAIVPWLLEYTAMLINVRYVGSDGKTAWSRARGRSFGQNMLNFGEQVFYRLPSKGPLHDPDGNMGARWVEASYIGYNKSSNTYLLINEAGPVSARTMRRRPESERWSSEKLVQIQATPWSVYERPDIRVRFRDADAPDDGVQRDPTVAIRNMRLNKRDFDQYGYTDGCVQCEYTRRIGRTQPGRIHTAACRARMIEAIAQTDEGRHRISQYDERLTDSLARHIERDDRIRAAAPSAAPTEFLPAEHEPAGAAVVPSPSRAEIKRPAPASTTQVAARSPVVALPGGSSDPAPSIDLEAAPREEDDDTDMRVENENPPPDDDDADDNMLSHMMIGSLEPTHDDHVSTNLLQQLGGFVWQWPYGRETTPNEAMATLSHVTGKSRAKDIVTEIYSLPRDASGQRVQTPGGLGRGSDNNGS